MTFPFARALLCSSLLCLAGCNDGSGDPKAQIGANPVLPEIQQYLLPPMHIARIVGWKKDETPTVAQGLQAKAFATGLQHPRSLYVLPNGDVLAVIAVRPAVEAAVLHRCHVVGDQIGAELVPLVDDRPQRAALRLEAQAVRIAQAAREYSPAAGGAVDLEDVGAIVLGLHPILGDVAVGADASIEF